MNNAIIGFIVGAALSWAGATIYDEQHQPPAQICPKQKLGYEAGFATGQEFASDPELAGWSK